MLWLGNLWPVILSEAPATGRGAVEGSASWLWNSGSFDSAPFAALGRFAQDDPSLRLDHRSPRTPFRSLPVRFRPSLLAALLAVPVLGLHAQDKLKEMPGYAR